MPGLAGLLFAHIGTRTQSRTPAPVRPRHFDGGGTGILGGLGSLGGRVGLAARGLLLVLGNLGGDHLDLAAGLLDRFERALAGTGDLEARLGLELALAEQAHAVLAAARQARGLERFVVDQLLAVELALVDELLDHAQVHFGEVLAERVVEAALRQTHVQRHLAALEALDGDAGTALLALLAAAAGLALARTDAPAHADATMAGAFVVADVVKFHVCTRFRFKSRWCCVG